MDRFSALMITATIVAGAATAGQIGGQVQVGGANGLTDSYISAGGSLGGYIQKNYDYYLFNGVLTGSGPGTSYNATYGSSGNPATPPNNTIADNTNGITFDMMDDGCGGTAPAACAGMKTNNVWVSGQTGSHSTLDIPIGVYNATQVWTMLSNEYGTGGAQDTTIEFDFGNTATTTNGTELVVNLVNSSSNSMANGNGQIRTGTTSTNGTCSGCSGLANSATSSSSTVNGITVITNRIFSQTYNAGQLTNANGPFIGSTAGTVFLNDQGFLLGTAYQGMYLVDVLVTDNVATANVSQTAISAITVVASPEPSTVWLSCAGLVGLAAFAIRRRRLA